MAEQKRKTIESLIEEKKENKFVSRNYSLSLKVIEELEEISQHYNINLSALMNLVVKAGIPKVKKELATMNERLRESA